jgi:hypothetical protein
MPTSYSQPLNAAYERMRLALFRPFNLDTWAAVGFASWISGWGTPGNFGSGIRIPQAGSDPEVHEALYDVLDWLRNVWADPFSRAVLVSGLLTLVGLFVLIIWINARSEFAFLDSVLHRRRAIVAPWREYRRQGQSLFIWLLVFTVISLTALAGILWGAAVAATGGEMPRTIHEVPWLRLAVAVFLVWLPFAVVVGYIHHFLRHFVTPLMYRDRSTTTEAWRKFGALFRERPGSFLLYGLIVFGLRIGLGLALIPAICVTCCVLGCLLALPYVGAVVWLPVSYGFRGLGPEFLRQFGEAFAMPTLPPPAPSTPQPEAPPPSGP